MNLGYVKVSAFSPKIKVGMVDFNLESIKKGIDRAIENNAELIAFPELCLTGATVGDFFSSTTLLNKALKGVKELASYTQNKNIITFVGFPFSFNDSIYDSCAVIANGKILGIVPNSTFKSGFSTYNGKTELVNIFGEEVAFGNDLIFTNGLNEQFKVAVEIGADRENPYSLAKLSTKKGVKIIVNLSIDPEFSLENIKKQKAIENCSLSTTSCYIYANASEGESTTDFVFSGHNIIAENGVVLAQNYPFEDNYICAEVDLDYITFERNKKKEKNFSLVEKEYKNINFFVENTSETLSRVYDKTPFINLGEEQLLIDISAYGLKKRIEHVKAQKLVLGLSGGLDSTLALIIACRAMQLLDRKTKDIIAITMPCFGTSKRTFDNSIVLAKAFNVTLKKIDILKAVKRHLKDISHPEDVHDACYENSQARERTQILMDYANACNGIVIGTGDLSELALGFATYNGDHMSMYALNASIPKTLVRHLVDYTANNGRGKFKAVLKDILDTPVSPELLPSNDNTIKQVTEDIVGPSILHDFYLYHLNNRGSSLTKIYYMAVNTFKGYFDKEIILKWLKTFARRFFNQQFKRSCLPDGAKVSEISLSPREGLKMPSDLDSTIWIEELEKLG